MLVTTLVNNVVIAEANALITSDYLMRLEPYAYFYGNEYGTTNTVNGDTYRTMITDFFLPTLHGIDENDVTVVQ